MSVAYKSDGAMVSSVSASTLPLSIPALVSGDYVTAVVIAFGAGTVTPPSGWAEVGTAWLEGSFYYHVFWKKVTGATSATTENFVMPTVGYAGKATVLTGAAASAPNWTHVNNGSAAAYWQSPTITTTGFYVANGILFASRTPSGSFTTTGTITSTNTYLNHESFTGSGISGFRWELASYAVSAVTSGAIRPGLSGTATTSDVILLAIPPDVGDTTNPVVDITAPVDAATIAGTTTLTATLTDNVAVTSASATLDGTTSLGALTNTSGTTWSLGIDTTVIANGAHTIVVTALDGSGNSDTDSVSVTVLNEFNTISNWNGATETVLSPSTLTYWNGTNEYGFWYPHVSTYHPSGPVNKLSYWNGTTESVVRLVDNPTTSALDGLRYLALGDSYGVVQTAAGVDYTASDLFPAQLATALGATLTNGHINSYMAMDVAYLLNNISGVGGAWVAGNFDMITVHAGGNDLKLVGTDAGLNEYINGIQAIIGLMRLATRQLASASASTGTWGSLGNSGTSGGALYSNTPGSSRTFTATGTGFTVIMLAGRDGSGSAFTVAVDGGTPTAYTTVNQAATNPVVSGSYGLVPVHIHDLANTSHTIKITHTGGSSDYLLIDSLSIWATDPADIPYILFAPIPSPPAGFSPPGEDLTVTPEQVQTYRDALRDILIEHSDVGKFSMLVADSYDRIFWDAVAAGDPILISDGMHPNKAGCDLLAEIWIGNARRIFPVPPPPPPPAPIAAYSFDEGSGTTAVDATGNGHTASVNAFGTGHTSYGAVGSSSASAASYTGPLLTSPVNFTVMCWVKPVTPSGQPDLITLLDDTESTYAGAYWVDQSNIKLFVQDSAGYAESSPISLTVGSWTHVAIAVTSTNATMYFNGSSITTVNRSGTMGNQTGVFLGGHGAKGGGTYDDLRVFDTALTVTDITTYMNTPVIMSTTPIVTTTALNGVYQGRAFSQTLSATNTPTSWAVASGSLPAELSLNTTTGEITGTPSGSPGTSYSFSITATNGSGTSSAKAFSGTVTAFPLPIVEWGLNEGAGTTAADSSGNGHTGTVTSDGWTTGHSPHTYAAEGNSSNPAVKSEGVTLMSSSKTATLMCWVKAVNYTGTGDLIEIKSTNTGTPAYLTIYRPGNSTTLHVEYGDSNGTLTDTSPDYSGAITGEWLHIAATLSETVLRLYVNGVMIGSSSVAGTGNLADTKYFYAGGTDTKPNQGVVNDVRLFDTALTADAVTTYMNTPVSVSVPSAPVIAATGTSGYSNGTPIAPGVPAGVTTGSLVIMQGYAICTTGSVPTVASVSVDGFTVSSVQPILDTPDNIYLVTFWAYKYATGADTGTYLVSHADGGHDLWAVARRITGGPISGDPFIDTVQVASMTPGTTLTIPSFTPSGDSSLLLFEAIVGGAGTTTYPTGWTRDISEGDPANIDIGYMIQTTATATGDLTWTQSSGPGMVTINTIRSATPIRPTPLLAYSFDEGTGTTATDASGNGHNGTVSGSWVAGHTASGVAGTSSVVATSVSSLGLTAGPFTTMFWYHPVQRGVFICAALTSDSTGGMALRWNSSDNRIIFGNGITSDNELSFNEWTHVAIVVTNDTAQLYLNGVLSASGTGPGVDYAIDHISIGGFTLAGAYDAGNSYDDLRFFGTALTAAEITTYMNTPV